MHELGMCEAILDATLARARGRRVRAVRVRVGGHPVDPEVINHGVRVAAMGTVAEDVRVDVVAEPTLLRCRDCGHETRADEPMALVACRQCGGLDIDLDGTDQVVLESITVDDGSSAWTPSSS
jgi:hydrogenase nickel incorporation protein HypA/HybF